MRTETRLVKRESTGVFTEQLTYKVVHKPWYLYLAAGIHWAFTLTMISLIIGSSIYSPESIPQWAHTGVEYITFAWIGGVPLMLGTTKRPEYYTETQLKEDAWPVHAMGV